MSVDDPGPHPTYGHLHATVVDAIRYISTGQSLDRAADEVLQRLRDAGLPIPPPGLLTVELPGMAD